MLHALARTLFSGAQTDVAKVRLFELVGEALRQRDRGAVLLDDPARELGSDFLAACRSGDRAP